MPESSKGVNGATKHAPLRRISRPVKLTLDREREIVYDLNAICSFEDVAGGQSVIDALRNLTMRNVRALIWAGLLADDPELTLQEAGALIRFTDIATVTAALQDALRSDLAQAEGAADRPTTPAPAPAAVSIGVGSGVSADSA